jgi:hypothetical protein
MLAEEAPEVEGLAAALREWVNRVAENHCRLTEANG